METNAKYFFVGLSLLLLIAIGAGGIYWVTRSGNEKNQLLYVVNFRENSLSGVTGGSNVTMRGLRVGTVRSLDFLPDDIEGVKVVLALLPGTPIKIDTQAVVQRNLVTGQAVIDLIKTSKAAPLLVSHGDEEYPVIKEGQGEVEAIKVRVPEILDHTSELLARMERVFSPENSTHASEFLDNLDKISADLTKDGNKPSDLLGELRSTTKEIKDIAAEIKNALIPFANALSVRAQSVTNSVNSATTSVSAAAQNLDNPRSIVTGPSTADVGPGEVAP